MPVLARRAARAAAVLTPLLGVLAVVAPAAAAAPISWDTGEEMSTLENLLLIVGAPLALLVLITLLVMAPSVAKGTNKQSHVPWYAEPLHFGTEPADETSDETMAQSPVGGGASVRW